MKKYKLTDETMNIYGRTLYRIEAVKDFADVKKGDKGGWVESENNLSQEDNCWIYDNAKVYDDDARVVGNACISGEAEVYDDAKVYGNAKIAPIGHYVTITTPAKKYVNVSMSVELMNTVTLETIKEDIERKISEYFETVRKSFGQNVNLTIYRARIIEKVLELEEVLNVKDVALNGNFTDVIFVDEGLIGYQYLPYMGEVTIE